MAHSERFEFYRDFYYYGFISKHDVWKACKRGGKYGITKDEYKEITGEEWSLENEPPLE